MKYRAKTDRHPFGKGTEFIFDESIEGIEFSTAFDDMPRIGREYLQKYPNDFKAVEEEFKEGDWVWIRYTNRDKSKLVKLHNKIHDVFNLYQVFDSQKEDGAYKANISIIERKATPDDIEQALIKEAKRRGFEEGVSIDNGNLGHSYAFGKLNGNKPYYISGIDVLSFGSGYIYKQGKWAEIVDQPITINGYEVEFEDQLFKVGCAVIHNEDYRVFRNFLYDFDLKIYREGEDITEQIKQIAERL